MEYFKCFGCNKEKERADFHERNHGNRPVQSKCKECRKKYHTPCKVCGIFKKLNSDGICVDDDAFKICKICKDRLLKEFGFYPNRKVCKKCYIISNAQYRVECVLLAIS